MEKLENIIYDKLTYNKAIQRINNLFKNENLIKLGLKKTTLEKTEYNYPLDYIQVGYGSNELFIVAGTHSSETISIDFVIQLLEQLPNIKEFDPNIFKLNIIPIQNPEGFDIATSNLSQIPDQNFQEKSYEYYLRYRTDSIITNALTSLNTFFEKTTTLPPTTLTKELKHFINNNPNWKKLEDPKALPNIKLFNKLINQIPNDQNYNTLKLELLNICIKTQSYLNTAIPPNNFLYLFIEQIKKGLLSQYLWQPITNKDQTKLYQQMFLKQELNTPLQNQKLEQEIIKTYKEQMLPKGSQINHDSTGTYINLNANTPLNPGINNIKNNITTYNPGPKNNIPKYTKGPTGLPCQDINNFTYACENKALYKLLKESYSKGNYLATLLYHGTGGLIYNKPHSQLMTSNQYNEYYNYNQEIAHIYNQTTNYKILEESSSTGYGDLLRRTFPGVLMIELSKMGGNPIGPYGDENNIYNTINDNLNSIKNLLTYYKKTLTPQSKTKKKL